MHKHPFHHSSFTLYVCSLVPPPLVNDKLAKGKEGCCAKNDGRNNQVKLLTTNTEVHSSDYLRPGSPPHSLSSSLLRVCHLLAEGESLGTRLVCVCFCSMLVQNPSPKQQVFHPLIIGHHRVKGGHYVVNGK